MNDPFSINFKCPFKGALRQNSFKPLALTQLAFTCLKSTIKTIEQCVKSTPIYQKKHKCVKSAPIYQ